MQISQAIRRETRLKRRLNFLLLSAIILLNFIGINAASAASDSAQPAVNAVDGIGLKGYDPVAYFVSNQAIKLRKIHVRPERRRVSVCIRRIPRAPQGRSGGSTCRNTAATAHMRCRSIVSPILILIVGAVVDGKLYLNSGNLAQCCGR